MSTLLKPFWVRAELLKRHLCLFTSVELGRLFHATTEQTKYFLKESTRTGLLLRLKRGLYVLKTLFLPKRKSPTGSTDRRIFRSNMRSRFSMSFPKLNLTETE